MLKLVKYLKPFKKQLIIGPSFKLLEAIFELIVPLIMAKIIDKGIASGDASYVYKMGGLMVVLGFAGLIFALICQYSAAIASQGVGTNLRNDLFYHINSLSHNEIDKIGTTSLTTRITNDVNQLQLVVAMLIRLVVRAPFLVIGATVMSMMLDLKLSIIFLIIMPLVSLVLYIVMSKSIPFYRVIQKKLDRISLITRENLEGVRVIRAFSMQEREEKRFINASEDLSTIATNVGKISALLNPIVFLIINTAIIFIIWYGGNRVNYGVLTTGQVIAFVNYMTQISLALVVVANLVVIFTKASACAVRINEIFEMKPSVTEVEYEETKNITDTKNNKVNTTSQETTKDRKKVKISFRNVSFSYNQNNEYVLEDINVDIMEGETIGIIGGTGSGKSTFVNLIPRFYDVTTGNICVDGKDVKDYSFSKLRSKFGIVPQKAVLFHGSILENMRWRKEDADLKEIKNSLETAMASEFVEKLPLQYDTMIEQGAKNLSGGQKQRLTIARALVGNPEILILDDSSSALDYATDAKLRQALSKRMEHEPTKTIIYVTQRANTIKNCDKIIVLEDGKIVAIGKHNELFEDSEVYREICLSQLSTTEVNQC